MSTTIQYADSSQQQMKNAKTFAISMVPVGAAGGALLGYNLAKPWLKGGQVSDSFVKEATKQFYKDLPKQTPAPSTIIDTMDKEKLKSTFEGCFENLKKGKVKPKEELKGLETRFGDLVEKTVKSMKKNSAMIWGAIGGGIALLLAILTMKKPKNVDEKK